MRRKRPFIRQNLSNTGSDILFAGASKLLVGLSASSLQTSHSINLICYFMSQIQPVVSRLNLYTIKRP